MSAKPKLARLARLRKIRDAMRELESALLTLKQHFKVPWTNKSFQSLYYLVALAKKEGRKTQRKKE